MHIPLAARIVFMLVSVSARPWWISFVPRSDCTEAAEVVCSDDCSQVMVCLGIGLSGFLAVPVATCDARSNMKCSAVNRTCIPADQSDCRGFDDNGEVDAGFRCHNAGSFPDPYDCQKFHVCLEGESSSALSSCHGTSAYDPLSGECSLTTSDRVCTEGPIKRCNQLGQMGVVQENPRIYYLCMKKRSEIVPKMYLCPSSMIFNLSVASCVETSTTSSSVDTTTGPPRGIIDGTVTTAVSPWRKWTRRHSHGRHWEERRRWRSHGGRHHWVHTSTVPTSVLPWVTLKEVESTMDLPWRLRTPRLSYRRPYSGRTRWRSHHEPQRWALTATGNTTGLPRVTTGGASSTVVPWAELDTAFLPSLTVGGVDTTTAPGATPGNIVTTAVPLLNSGGVDPPRVSLTKADTTMITPSTMFGGADTAAVSLFVALGGVDTTTVQKATPGGAGTTEVPPQTNLVRVDTMIASHGNDHEFPESSRLHIVWETTDLVDTATIPSTTLEKSVVTVA